MTDSPKRTGSKLVVSIHQVENELGLDFHTKAFGHLEQIAKQPRHLIFAQPIKIDRKNPPQFTVLDHTGLEALIKLIGPVAKARDVLPSSV